MSRDNMSSPFLSHMCGEDIDVWDNEDIDVWDNEVPVEKDLKCCVWNCSNRSSQGTCFEFGGLVICAPCYFFLTTGMKSHSQLERNAGEIIKEEYKKQLIAEVNVLLKSKPIDKIDVKFEIKDS